MYEVSHGENVSTLSCGEYILTNGITTTTTTATIGNKGNKEREINKFADKTDGSQNGSK